MTPLLHASSNQIERFRAWCERMAAVARDSKVAGGGFYADTQVMRRAG